MGAPMKTTPGAEGYAVPSVKPMPWQRIQPIDSSSRQAVRSREVE